MNTHPKQNKIENDQLFPKSIRASTICSSLVIQAGNLSIFVQQTNTNQTKLEIETTIQPLGNLEFKIKVEHVTKCNKMVQGSSMKFLAHTPNPSRTFNSHPDTYSTNKFLNWLSTNLGIDRQVINNKLIFIIHYFFNNQLTLFRTHFVHPWYSRLWP